MAKVIRIPRTDGPENEPAFVLVHVSSKRSHPLDCKLIGTENTQVYLVSLKHTKTADLLKSKTYTHQQWDQVLSHVLFGTPVDEAALVEGLEVVATADELKLTITIRKLVGEFKQKVGTIVLLQNDAANDEFDGFEWCGLVLEATNTSSHELDTLKSKVKEQEEAVQKLEASFKDLLKAKTEHEDELLQKFAALLNEKKLKIRDQQRLLAGANVDPRILAAVEATREPRSRAAGISRAGKRKADQKMDVEEDNSDEGFEKMDVDVDQAPNDSDQDRAMTPNRDDDSTADETEDTDVELVPAGKPSKHTISNVKNCQTDTSTSKGSPSTSKVGAEDNEPPAPRTLPFGRKPAAMAKPAVVEGSETESDDEL